ncbi:MAG: DNA gyrase C-terminal beta-propeller domain-containing protein [Kouleothrix sp.]
MQANGALLVITTNGFGKRTLLGEYPPRDAGWRDFDQATREQLGCHRARGIQIVAAHVHFTGGTVIALAAEEISQLGRSTQGVTILNVVKNDHVAALSVEEPGDEDERSLNVLITMNGDGEGTNGK